MPGGARDSHETAEQAAVREAHEEAGLPAEHVRVRTTVVTAEVGSADGGLYWSYTTVIADAESRSVSADRRAAARTFFGSLCE